MSLNSAVRDEAACRNAANKSLFVLPGCLNFRVLRFTHPKEPSGLLPPKAAANTFVEEDPDLLRGRSPQPGRAKKYSEPSVRPQGGSRHFQLGVTANRNQSA